jgi:hypothetical protein
MKTSFLPSTTSLPPTSDFRMQADTEVFIIDDGSEGYNSNDEGDNVPASGSAPSGSLSTGSGCIKDSSHRDCALLFFCLARLSTLQRGALPLASTCPPLCLPLRCSVLCSCSCGRSRSRAWRGAPLSNHKRAANMHSPRRRSSHERLHQECQAGF